MVRRLTSLVCVLAFLGACLAPPARAEDLSLSKEKEIGQKAFKEISASLPMVKDPDCASYIQDLGNRLSDALGDDRFKFRFYIANEDEKNAFALPGGWIVMYRGMMVSMNSEGELVAVLAHEISHVHYRHIAARMKKSAPVQAATIAGMAAGVLLGLLGGAPQLGSALTVGSMAGGVQKMLSYSREDETQADYGGYKLMSKAGYHPKEMETTFSRMWQQERLTSASTPTYLLTHPTSPARLESISNMVRRHPAKAKPYDNSRFLLVRTRLESLYGPADQAEKKFALQVKQKPNDPYALYGLALSRMRLSEFKQAKESLNKLDKLWDQNPHLWRAQGRCCYHLGDYPKARQLFTRVLVHQPGDVIARLGLGQTELRQGNLEQAVSTLSKLIASHPDNAQAQFDLGVALGKLERTAEASYHLGLSFKIRGNKKLALYHLKRAEKRLAGNPELQKKAKEILDEMEKPPKKKPPKEGAG